MNEELKKEVLKYFVENQNINLIYKQFEGQAGKRTLQRWCFPELNEKAKQEARDYHNKHKNNTDYVEKRKLKSQEFRKTEHYKQLQKQYYELNKEKIHETVKEHRLKNIEHYKQRAKENYQKNKKAHQVNVKKYRLENKQRLQALELARYHNDPITHLKQALRVSLNRALKHGKDIKTNRSLSYLGCSIEEFKNYLEVRFKEGMNWENRSEWHLDHIIPLDKINEGYTLEQLCHYSNFQPLWKTDNLSKGNRLTLNLNFPLEKLNYEKNFYLQKEGNYEILPTHNKIVLNFQPHFYDQERILWSDNNVRQKLIDNRCQYLSKSSEELTDAEILRGFKISGIYYGYSHFSPLWFKKFLTDYSIQSVYDPCGGWGHRMIGLLDTNVKKYVYNDFDIKTVSGAEKIKNFLELNDVVEIHNKKSEEFVPNEKVDAIFTCPPYFNKEKYNNKSFKDLNDFSDWWRKTVDNCLKLKPKYFGVVIDNQHLEIISNPFKNSVLALHQRLQKTQMHFSKQSHSSETLLVFQFPQ